MPDTDKFLNNTENKRLQPFCLFQHPRVQNVCMNVLSSSWGWPTKKHTKHVGEESGKEIQGRKRWPLRRDLAGEAPATYMRSYLTTQDALSVQVQKCPPGYNIPRDSEVTLFPSSESSVPGYTFITSSPPTYSLLYGPVVLFPSLMTLQKSVFWILFSERLFW